MSGWGAGMVVLCVSCGAPSEGPLPAGVVVTGADVRVGLTADDRLGGPPVLTGSGFQKIAPSSHVASVANGVVAGSLNDAGNALAVGNPASNWVLKGQVLAKPGAAVSRSDARVVEISTMDLLASAKLSGTRVVMSSVLTPTITGDASAYYEIDVELRYDGHRAGHILAEYALYPGQKAGMVEIYRGRRGTAGSRRVAVVRNGSVHTVEDPSFYFDLGPGEHELIATIKLSAAAPDVEGREGRTGVAGMEVVGRLRVESKSAPSAGGGRVPSAPAAVGGDGTWRAKPPGGLQMF